MKVKDIMTTQVTCCMSGTQLTEVAQMMVDCDCGEIPVVDETGRPIGVVTDRDIVCRTLAVGKNPIGLTASDCMTSPCVTVSPEDSVDDCCLLLEEKQIRRVPVVDESGQCCGIVAQADIARHGSKGETAKVLRSVSQKTAQASPLSAH